MALVAAADRVGGGVSEPVVLSWRHAVDHALTIVRSRWSISILSVLAQGPLPSTVVLAEVNSAGETTGRHGRPLDYRVFRDTVVKLVESGLLREHRESSPHPAVTYELTPRGRGLLVSLRPLERAAQTATPDAAMSLPEAVEAAAHVLRGRWAVAVLVALAQGPLRTGELLNEINSAGPDRITLRVLANTTTRLAQDGLLVRDDPSPSARRHTVTERGVAWLLALRALADWAQRG